MSTVPVVDILGIKVSVIDRPELLAGIERLAASGRVALVNNVNVNACNLAYEQSAFRAVLNKSEIVFCDGFGVKLGAALLGKKLGQRMTPPDWIDDLFALCIQNKHSVYFLGDTDEVVSLFAKRVKELHPELDIVGWHHGFFNLDGEENDRVVMAVAESGADIIITGMGMPRQELWAWEVKGRLNKGVVIAAGAIFRWYTGCEKRAPRWITDHGLEGLSRLMVSPVKHFKRYGVGVPVFLIRIIQQRFSDGKMWNE